MADKLVADRTTSLTTSRGKFIVELFLGQSVFIKLVDPKDDSPINEFCKSGPSDGENLVKAGQQANLTNGDLTVIASGLSVELPAGVTTAIAVQ